MPDVLDVTKCEVCFWPHTADVSLLHVHARTWYLGKCAGSSCEVGWVKEQPAHFFLPAKVQQN